MSKKEDRVRAAWKEFQQAESARQTVEKKMIELDKFDRGEQWETQAMPPWIPKPVTNYIHLVKTTQRANLALQNQSATLQARYPEDMDAVKMLQLVLDNEWDASNARYTVRTCTETALLMGHAPAYVYFDDHIYGKKGKRYRGKIVTEVVDPINFYPDPHAYDVQKCRFIHVTSLVPVDEVKNNPKFKEYAGKELANIDQEYSMGEENPYFRQDKTSISNSGMAILRTHWKKVPLENGEHRLEVSYIVNGVEVYYIEDVKPSIYPFAILYDYRQRKSIWGKSTGELILENQKLVNKVEQVAAIIGSLLQNPQKIVAADSGIKPQELADEGNLAGKVWVTKTNVESSVKNLDPPNIPRELFTLAQQARDNIREITGLNEAYTGESVGSLTTSTGVQALIERATIRDKDKMVEIERFIEELVRIMLSFVVEKYEEERYIRILGEDGSAVFERFKGTDYKDIEFDIQVDISSRMPTTRALMQSQAKDLLNMQGQFGFEPPIITPEEVIERFDIRDKETILQRMKQDRERRQMDTIMQATMMATQMLMQGVPQEQVVMEVQNMVTQMTATNGAGMQEGENKSPQAGNLEMESMTRGMM